MTFDHNITLSLEHVCDDFVARRTVVWIGT